MVVLALTLTLQISAHLLVVLARRRHVAQPQRRDAQVELDVGQPGRGEGSVLEGRVEANLVGGDPGR